jgi:metal-responsive CopG/Arc/MetJ family transcriptional regulator
MTDAKLLPDDLLHQVEETARAQHRKPAEVVQEAVREYLDKLSWVQYVERNERRAHAKGLTEDDVPRLVAEVRRENRERQR